VGSQAGSGPAGGAEPGPVGLLRRRSSRRPGALRTVDTAFTDRTGGVSRAPWDSLDLGTHVGDEPLHVSENRHRLATGLGLDPDRVVWMDQVHGARVEVVDGPRDAPVPAADALVTAVPGLALAVLVADCVPVLLADAQAGVVAAVHAGRRGVEARVVDAALDAMAGVGASLTSVTAELGPSICGGCYEVPGAMRDTVAAVAPDAATVTRAGTAGLDLRRGLAALLEARGVRVEHVGGCTAESPTLFSHRRDGVTGRSAGLVWLG
jgi:YfiH family protein